MSDTAQTRRTRHPTNTRPTTPAGRSKPSLPSHFTACAHTTPHRKQHRVDEGGIVAPAHLIKPLRVCTHAQLHYPVVLARVVQHAVQAHRDPALRLKLQGVRGGGGWRGEVWLGDVVWREALWRGGRRRGVVHGARWRAQARAQQRDAAWARALELTLAYATLCTPSPACHVPATGPRPLRSCAQSGGSGGGRGSRHM